MSWRFYFYYNLVLSLEWYGSTATAKGVNLLEREISRQSVETVKLYEG